MPRGGYRENAGRPTSWESGCKFEDTKVIRVPKGIADKILELARKLDAGWDIDLDTESIEGLREENDYLKQLCQKLQNQLTICQQELKQVKSSNSQARQLELFQASHSLSGEDLEIAKKKYLDSLKLGKQSSKYKTADKVCSNFIEILKQNDLVTKTM